jgi:hypothetical protein
MGPRPASLISALRGHKTVHIRDCGFHEIKALLFDVDTLIYARFGLLCSKRDAPS